MSCLFAILFSILLHALSAASAGIRYESRRVSSSVHISSADTPTSALAYFAQLPNNISGYCLTQLHSFSGVLNHRACVAGAIDSIVWTASIRFSTNRTEIWNFKLQLDWQSMDTGGGGGFVSLDGAIFESRLGQNMQAVKAEGKSVLNISSVLKPGEHELFLLGFSANETVLSFAFKIKCCCMLPLLYFLLPPFLILLICVDMRLLCPAVRFLGPILDHQQSGDLYSFGEKTHVVVCLLCMLPNPHSVLLTSHDVCVCVQSRTAHTGHHTTQ
jgi:hypothetical protein